MAHMITDTDHLFSVRQTPWHGLGTVVEEYPGSWDEARVLAGLAWEPVETPVWDVTGMDDDGKPVVEQIEGFKRIARSDNNTTLHVARNSYEVIDHQAMGQLVEAVLDIPGVQWETAGSLDGGRRVWALARTGSARTITGDFTEVQPYVALLNAHDASSSCQVIATSTRIVCQNTFSAAAVRAKNSGTTYSLRHTKNWRTQVEAAREAIGLARREFDAMCGVMEELAHIYITPAQSEAFVREFFPLPVDGMVTDRVARNVEAARDQMRLILMSETTAPVAHTAYGLVQAAGEYADWCRPTRNAESRFTRAVLKTDDLKRRAAVLARDVVLAS